MPNSTAARNLPGRAGPETPQRDPNAEAGLSDWARIGRSGLSLPIPPYENLSARGGIRRGATTRRRSHRRGASALSAACQRRESQPARGCPQGILRNVRVSTVGRPTPPLLGFRSLRSRHFPPCCYLTLPRLGLVSYMVLVSFFRAYSYGCERKKGRIAPPGYLVHPPGKGSSRPLPSLAKSLTSGLACEQV